MFKNIRKTNKIVLAIIVLVFFVGDNVCNKFGFSLPVFKLILCILCAVSLPRIKRIYKTNPQVIRLLVFCFLYMIFKIATGGQAGNTMMGITVILPIFIYVAYRVMEKDRNALAYKKVLYLGYVYECLVAIIERIMHTHIFLWNLDIDTADYIMDFDMTEFRSWGLYGHPLQNAVVIEVFILFILVFEQRVKYKYALSILGVLAILCFNTRAAIVMSSLSVVVYTIYWLRKGRISVTTKSAMLIALLFIIGGVYYLFSQGMIGGRLSSMGLYDDSSAAVRVAALDIFKYYNLSDFIFGISRHETTMLQFRLGLIAVENFWLNWMLGYGVAFIAGLVFFYTPVIKRILSGSKLFIKTFLFLPFIVLASTNPSLAVSIVPTTAFLLLSHIMPLANYRQQ